MTSMQDNQPNTAHSLLWSIILKSSLIEKIDTKEFINFKILKSVRQDYENCLILLNTLKLIL